MPTDQAGTAAGFRKPKAPPKVGMVMAFTGHYLSSRLVARFLEEAGARVVKSQVTTPAIQSVAAGLANAELCLPLRTYIGHVHALVAAHPDLDYLVMPLILSEDNQASTCSKYRDLAGATVRSLGSSVDHALGRAPAWLSWILARVAGSWRPHTAAGGGQRLPPILEPEIRHLSRDYLLPVCFELYRSVFRLGPWVRAELLLPRAWWGRLAPHLHRVKEYLDRAWVHVMEHDDARASARRLSALLADPGRVRIGLVGRRYLIEDPALSSGAKNFFRRRGVVVITPYDVPAEELKPYYDEKAGYYDTHRLYEAFIHWAQDKVDGFVVVGSFGCHPDAFMNDYLADKIRRLGRPCWVLKFDEPASDGGFFTRYETIIGFLEMRRDRRLALATTGPVNTAAEGPAGVLPGSGRPARPVIVWPDMGPVVNLPVMEILHQLGLTHYAWPPKALDAEAMQLGNDLYTESCSPYAAATGTLKRSIMEAQAHFDREAALSGQPPVPLRFVVLMARGEGPCTFGWYAIAHKRHLAGQLAPVLASRGHTVSLVTAGLDGLGELLEELARTGNAERIRAFQAYLEASRMQWRRMRRWEKMAVKLNMWGTLAHVFLCGWEKMGAVEEVRALAMTVRAHEARAGDTTNAYHQALEMLAGAHGVLGIRRARRKALRLLRQVPVDRVKRPRVAAVGEIYVATASYANRGALEKLLGDEGIEVVPGTSVRAFVGHSLKEMVRRAVWRQPPLSRWASWASRRGWYRAGTTGRGRDARPFAWRDAGGEGITSVAAARRLLEDGCDGIVHVYPFKCMPEGLVKGAMTELASFYGVPYLGLSFDRENDLERLRTEIATFAAVLRETVREGRWPVLSTRRFRSWKRRLAGTLLNLAGRVAGSRLG